MDAGLDVWVWLSVGVALIAAEALIPGMILMWFGIGALAAAAMFSVVDLTLDMQILVFAVVSLVALLAGRRPMKRLLARRREDASDEPPSGLNARAKSLIGRPAVLEGPMTGRSGRVRVGDSAWSASGPDLPDGAHVKITGIDGNVLLVEKAD